MIEELRERVEELGVEVARVAAAFGGELAELVAAAVVGWAFEAAAEEFAASVGS